MHLSDRDRAEVAAILRLSVRDPKDEAALFRAHKFARRFGVLDLYDAMTAPPVCDKRSAAVRKTR